jgi:hypothetical protein
MFVYNDTTALESAVASSVQTGVHRDMEFPIDPFLGLFCS